MKKIRRIIFFLLIIFSSCVQTNTNQQVDNADTLELRKGADKVFKNNTTAPDTSPGPTIAFINFSCYLDSIGYIADISRAKIVSYRVLENAKIKYFSNRPFYRLLKKNPDVFLMKDRFKSQPVKDSTVNYKIFENANYAFGYFYRQNIQGNWIEDGVIEEWQFLNDEDAKEAMNQINKIKHLVYFNTRSFTLQHNNILYIFHTRSSAFELTLNKNFKEFVKRINSGNK